MNSQYPEKPSNRDPHRGKRSVNKTAIVIGTVAAILVGTFGYEFVKIQRAQATNQQPLKLIPSQKQLVSLDALNNTKDGHKMRLLNETNRQQAEKIKELQAELAELSQSFHEYKLSLFSRSNPADLALIQRLTQELEQKNTTLETLEATLATGQSLQSQEQQRLLLTLAEESQILGDLKDIVHNQMSRDAERQVIERLEELQTFYSLSTSTERDQSELVNQLSTLLELENTISLLNKKNYKNALRRLASIYNLKLNAKELQVDALGDTVNDMQGQMAELEILLASYNDLDQVNKELGTQEKSKKWDEATNAKKDIQRAYVEKLRNINNQLRSEQSKTAALYETVEAQEYLLSEAAKTLEENELLLNNALETYEKSVQKARKLESLNEQYKSSLATQLDFLHYQYVHTQQSDEASNKLIQQHQTVLTENDQLKSELQKLQRVYHNLQRSSLEKDRAFNTLATEHETLAIQLEAQRQLANQLEKTKSYLKALAEKNKKQDEQLREYRAIAANQLHQLVVQEEALQDHALNAGEKQALQTQILDKEHQLILLSQQIEDLRKVKGQNKQLAQRLDEFRSISNAQLHQLSTQEGVIDSLKSKLEIASSETNELQQKLSQLQVNLLDRDHQMSLVIDENERQKGLKNDTLAQTKKMIEAYKQLKRDNQTLIAQVNDMSVQLKEVESQYKRQKELVSIKERELHSTIEADTLIRTQLIEQVAQLQHQLEEAQQR